MSAATPVKFYAVKDYENETGFKLPDQKKIEAAVMKAQRDNLKGWQKEESDGNRDADGYTCRQRLWDMKALHIMDPKRFAVSKLFTKT